MNIDDIESLDEATRENIEELEKVIRKSESDEDFSLAQKKLAEIYYKYGLLDEAVRVSKLIEPQDSKEHYQKAQYNIAAVYEEHEPPRVYRRVIYLSQAAIPDRIKLS